MDERPGNQITYNIFRMALSATQVPNKTQTYKTNWGELFTHEDIVSYEQFIDKAISLIYDEYTKDGYLIIRKESFKFDSCRDEGNAKRPEVLVVALNNDKLSTNALLVNGFAHYKLREILLCIFQEASMQELTGLQVMNHGIMYYPRKILL